MKIILPFLSILFSLTLMAQTSVTSTATAEVIEALRAAEIAALNFGRFSPETSGGEIRVTPQGVRSSDGTVSLSGGQYNPASFQLVGQSDATISIILPQSSTTLIHQSTGKTMEVYRWEMNNITNVGTAVLTKGTLILSIGATLKVGTVADNPIGKYSGTYVITFSYN
ncbi:MAG: DUF4402 domain-containing protein [Bacteroidales bacterium]|jgi:hypothetical protein|nr:DUF4402 domain-containing protein [Bacteroidales bacterium]MDD4058118.1 DUF4402 domain-containing protein [Bacteroidales bacterium]